MNYYSAMIIKSNISNIVRFSFLTFDIARTTMWIHAQLTLQLNNKNKMRILDKIKSVDTTFVTTDPKSLDFKISNSFYTNFN